MAVDIIASILTAGSNNHETSSEDANGVATDFVGEGVVGSITNTSGVSPSTGAFAVNAASTPDMTVIISPGVLYIEGTPTSQATQRIRGRMASDYTGYTISDNSSGSTKYDWLYVKFDSDTAANPNASASDVFTIVTSRSTSATTDDGTPPTYGIPIARITVSNGATSITNANITDLRSQSTFSQGATLTVDSVNELTTDHGVTIEGINFKDGKITTDDFLEDGSVTAAKNDVSSYPYASLYGGGTDSTVSTTEGTAYANYAPSSLGFKQENIITFSGSTTTPLSVTIPTGQSGIYSVHFSARNLASSGQLYGRLLIGSNTVANHQANNSNNSTVSCDYTGYVSAGTVVSITAQSASGTANYDEVSFSIARVS